MLLQTCSCLLYSVEQINAVQIVLAQNISNYQIIPRIQKITKKKTLRSYGHCCVEVALPVGPCNWDELCFLSLGTLKCFCCAVML